MSIVLSAAVRQNLLALQDTATNLSVTQNRLSTGKKVNSALDNPTNFFTAAGLDNRASDISNLLDGISNGVQVLQAANTGITSLQKLIDSAKSIANQALQSPSGYSTKSNVTTTITGATADDLRGSSSYLNAEAASTTVHSGAGGGTTAAALTDFLSGSSSATITGTNTAAFVPATSSTLLSALGAASTDVLTFDGVNFKFDGSGSITYSASAYHLDVSTANVGDLISALNSNTGGGLTLNADGSIDASGSWNIGGTSTSGGAALLGGVPSYGGMGPQTIGYIGSTSAGISGSATLTSISSSFNSGASLSVNGKTINFATGSVPTTVNSGSGINGNLVTDGKGNSTVYLGAATTNDLLNAIDIASGAKYVTVSGSAATLTAAANGTTSAVGSGIVSLGAGTGADLTISSTADLLHSLGLTASTGSTQVTLTAARAVGATSLGTLVSPGSTLNVDGKTVTFADAVAPGSTGGGSVPAGSGAVSGHSNVVTDGKGNSTVYLRSGAATGATLYDALTAIDIATGVKTVAISGGVATASLTSGTVASTINSSGVLALSTGTSGDLSITGTGNALAALGLTGAQGTSTSYAASRTASPAALSGKHLTFSAFNGGTAVDVTFGDGTNGTVKTLAQLNTQLATNNLAATIDSLGKLTISASNDYASSKLGGSAGGVIGGTATGVQSFSTAQDPVTDIQSQSTRANLVTQYNNILEQIDKTAADASFNGVNLLGGDQLQLVFNESGKSKLNVNGVTYNATGLSLAPLTAGTDFIDNNATNKVLSQLTSVSSTLRAQASTFGSNLSVVQNRQDFNKNLVNVLGTGSANLTQADINEEAANSQALSTRQSLSVSALSLANQAQQSVLQLLR